MARSASARAAAAAAALLTLACAAQLAAATHFPTVLGLNGASVSLLPGGKRVRLTKAAGGGGVSTQDVAFKPPPRPRRPVRGAPPRIGTFNVTLVSSGSPGDMGGSWWNVSWTGADKKEVLRSDRIAVYYGKAPNTRASHPAKFVFVRQVAPSTWDKGSGSVRLWLPPTRDFMTFGYQRSASDELGIWMDSEFLASVTVPPTASAAPHNVKLSVGVDKATGNRLTRAIWSTAAPVADASLRWKPDGGSWTVVKATGSRAPTKAAMCDAPANQYQFPGMYYTAVFGPGSLPASTKIVYQVGSEATGWGREFAFFTPPPAEDPSGETRFLITADMGNYAPDNAWMPDGNMFMLLSQYLFLITGATDDISVPETQRFTALQALLMSAGAPNGGQQPATKHVIAALLSELANATAAGKPYHGVAINGDISYARGEPIQWEAFSTLLEPVLTQAVGFHTTGNHEAGDNKYPDWINAPLSPYNDGGGECNLLYRSVFRMPQPAGPKYDYYSFRMGPVHFVQINTDQHLKPGFNQLKWLEAELAKVNRTATPWLVVSAHRPVYVDTAEAGEQEKAAGFVANLEPLLAKYEVDLYLAGHIHEMQRSCKGVYKGGCVAPDANGTALAPTHLLTGNAGFQAPLLRFNDTPAWLAAETYAFGFTKVIATRTSLKITSVTINGSTADDFELTKPAGWAPSPAAAAARYAAAPAVPALPSFDVSTLYTVMGMDGMNTLVNDPVFASTYLQPNTTFWRLANSPPGLTTYFSIDDVWQITYPVLEYFHTNPPPSASPAERAILAYIYKAISPGGRMYYGP